MAESLGVPTHWPFALHRPPIWHRPSAGQLVLVGFGVSAQLSVVSLHVTSVHGVASSPQSLPVVPATHSPSWQRSPSVQNSPSSHSLSAGSGTIVHTGGSCSVSHTPS
jgi:hypothetical protein